jgi:hypothetical protein
MGTHTDRKVNIRTLWDNAPCSLIVVDQCFRGAYCHHLHTFRRENLKSYTVNRYGEANLRYVPGFESFASSSFHRPDDGGNMRP